MNNTNVQKAELELIEVYEEAQKITRKNLLDYIITEDEKNLQFKARWIQGKVRQAIEQAEVIADALSEAEVVQYPKAYQVLLDEITPLRKRQRAQDRTQQIIVTIKGDQAGSLFGPDIASVAKDTGSAWSDALLTDNSRINTLSYQLRNKFREGSKARQARADWNNQFRENRHVAAYKARTEIYKANPDWKDFEVQYDDLLQTAQDRKDVEIRGLHEPIRKALENLQQASLPRLTQTNV